MLLLLEPVADPPGRALLIDVVSRETELELSGGTLILAVVVRVELEAAELILEEADERVVDEVVDSRVDDGELVATLDAVVEGIPEEVLETILELSDDLMLK